LSAPEAEEVEPGGRGGVAGAVERAFEAHADRVEREGEAHDPERAHAVGEDLGVLREEADEGAGENDEDEADNAEEDGVELGGDFNGGGGAVGSVRAEVLADEGRAGVGETPGGHEGEDDHANGDGVTGEDGTAEDREDFEETDPAGGGDQHLGDAVAGGADDNEEAFGARAQVGPMNADVAGFAGEMPELVEHADAAADVGGDSGTGDAHLGERAPAEDEARIEDEVEGVRQDERAHGKRGVAGSAENGVDDEDEEDGGVAAEHDAGVGGALGDNGVVGSHEAQDVTGKPAADEADAGGEGDAEDEDLSGGLRGEGGIFFTDAAGDDGGGREGDADGDREDERHDRLGEADDGDGVASETGDPEDVHDGEQRFHEHLQDHGDGEEQDGAVERERGVVVLFAAEGLRDAAPERLRRRGRGDGGDGHGDELGGTLSAFEQAGEVRLFGADAGEREGAAVTLGGGAVVVQARVEFAGDGMEQMERVETVGVGDGFECVESGLRAVDVSDRDGAVEFDDGRGFQGEEEIVVGEDAGPVGRGGVGRSAVERGDAGLQVVFAGGVALGGGGEVLEALVEETGVPLGAVLFVEAEECALVVETRWEAGAGEEHEGEQRVGARGAASGMGEEQRGQADRFAAEIFAEQVVAGGGFVALVEKQVECGEDAVEARGEVFGFGKFEGDIGFLDTLFGAGELFFDGGLAGEKGAGDFAGAEAAEDFEGEDDLGVGSDGGVAADEQEAKGVVADGVRGFDGNGGRGDGLLDVRDDRRLLGGRHIAVAQMILGEVHGDAGDPRRRVGRDAAHRPRAQGAEEGLLGDVLGE